MGGSGATYDDDLRLIEKRVVDFLFVLTELFSQVLRLRTDRKTDGRTAFSSLDRVCIACSAIKMSENVDDRLSFIAVLPYFDVTDQTDFVRNNRNRFNKVRCRVTRVSNYGTRRRRTAAIDCLLATTDKVDKTHSRTYIHGNKMLSYRRETALQGAL